MPRIERIRPVLLSAPYAHAASSEVRNHLRTGYRTCGLVEITLDSGETGIGEGYAAVFAPRVFVKIVELIADAVVGLDAASIRRVECRMAALTNYWSAQGAARHAISAIQIALVDATSKSLGVPAVDLYGGRTVDDMELYGSGGDSTCPEDMARELDQLEDLGISTLKIRARHHQVSKAVWTLEAASARGIAVAVDMAQNLAVPARPAAEVIRFVHDVRGQTDKPIVFLEEALGLNDRSSYPTLRQRINVPICGGETCTTPEELSGLIESGAFDFVQPDATVIGGIGAVMEVAAAARHHGIETVVHSWGGAVCMMANYHAAFAAGSRLAEWPMPTYPLRAAMLTEPLPINAGRLRAPSGPGLGVRLTPEIEARFPFRPDAVYDCSASHTPTDGPDPWSVGP